MRKLGPVSAEVMVDFQARRDRMLERASAFPILLLAWGLLLFNFWDRWLDPANADRALLVRAAAGALLLPSYLLLKQRRVHGLAARWLHGGVFLAGILGASLAALQLQDGLLWGSAGVLAFTLMLAFYPLPTSWFLAFNLAATVLICLLAWWYAVAERQLINFLVMQLLIAWAGLTAIRVLAKQQLRLFLLERRYAEDARTDVLTGLLNRRFIEELGARQVQASARLRRPLSVLMIDLDHFKAINDTHGHDVGDRALAAAAEAIARSVRAVDFVGRWGGEEFVALLMDADVDAAVRVAQRCLDGLRAIELTANGTRVPIDASIGVASRGEGEFFDAMIKRSDEALYRAKQAGRGRAEVAPAAPAKSA